MSEQAVPEPLEFVQLAQPREMTARRRQELIECWTVVSNAGGAVIPLEFPGPPVGAEQVAPAADALIAGLDPRRGRLPLAPCAAPGPR
ncbi:hypothetical protein AB0C96_21760 [Streptomyces sp. NPDC048506]|uniref:hypothetical protein n=1 Tax=Streptomyces sp. NPDC048506 TaxID=3155028 RepID=UPI003421995A